MKKTLGIVGILALSITPTASFPHHLEPKESEIRPGGNLAHTNLSFADLFGANLSDARLNGADLSDANLIRARLNGADLRGTNLTGANLSFADLSDANLIRARLNGADLSNANLSGITATNLRGCPFRLPNGWFCEKTRFRSALIQR